MLQSLAEVGTRAFTESAITSQAVAEVSAWQALRNQLLKTERL